MIVWGTSAKKNIKSSGEFFCPHCNSQRQYVYWDVDKYFDIFWIGMGPVMQPRVSVEGR